MRFVVDLIKALGGGPFMGPRGGKWADPVHTIPWKPEKAKDKAPKFKVTKTRRNWIPHHPDMPNRTIDKFRKADGTYKPERAALHNRIIDDFTRGKKPAPANRQKTAIVMMGGTASGKTSLVNDVLKDRVGTFVNVNPDDVKEELPEWKVGLDASAEDTAFVLHEESSDIAEQVYNEAIDKGLNLVVDGTGKKADRHIAKIQQLQKEGYHVTLLMPDIDTEVAVKRADRRAERTGRFVPHKIIRESHHLIPENFERIARASDSFALFDSRGLTAQLKWSGGKGEKDRVHDSQFVARFKSRGERLKTRTERLGPEGMNKFYIMDDDLKKAEPKKPPAVTLDEMVESIHGADPKTRFPDKKLPKKYDRTKGVIWPVEEFEPKRIPKGK